MASSFKKHTTTNPQSITGNNNKGQSTGGVGSKKPQIEERLEGEYLFKFQFFVHECSLTKDFYNIGRPAIAIRFLDFPTLIIEGKILENGMFKIQSGKKCNFKMHSEDLREALLQKPFFVMFVDANPSNIQMIAASNVSLAVYQEDQAFFEPETQNLNLRRNFIYLFDHMKNEVMKLDATIGISLLDRGEQERLQSKMERIHPMIPNARIGEEDRAALHLQSFGTTQKQNPNINSKVQVHFSEQEENNDPNAIIKQNKQQNQESAQQKQLIEQKQMHSQPSNKNNDSIEDQVILDTDIVLTQEDQEKQKLIQRLDKEHRYAINQQKQENSLQKLLEQPFQPPPMFYERKAKPQPEKALILKQQAKLVGKGGPGGVPKAQQMEVVKEALNLQQERFLEELDQKQKLIKHQQDVLARQNHLIQQQMEEKQKVQIDQEVKRQDKDYIQLNDIEKIRGLEPKDRYNVLEFLIKELIQLKAMDVKADGGRRRSHRRRRRRHSSSYDSEYDSQDESRSQVSKSGGSKQRKTKSKHEGETYKSKKSMNTPQNTNHLMPPHKKGAYSKLSPRSQKRAGTIDIINTEEDMVIREEVGKLESISVDDEDHLVHSSRKEWEEELTSTQNLGISVSMRKREDSSLRASQQKQYVEPIVKLQNFVAPVVKDDANSRFTSIKDSAGGKNRKISDFSGKDEESNNYEDEEFESMSKSQVGVSMSLNVKKNLNKKGKNDGADEDSYSNEFESIGDSKTLSNDATVICFMCKQQIPKSQALQHNKTCTKVQTSSKNKRGKNDIEGSSRLTNKRKYSPIREAEDEEAQSLKGSSKSNSNRGHYNNKAQKSSGIASSSDNYSSYRYDESESNRGGNTGKSSALSKNKTKSHHDNKKKSSNDYMRESYMSSSMSTEKPGVALFAKQVQDFMAGGGDDDSDSDDDYEESTDKKKPTTSVIGKTTAGVTSAKTTVIKNTSSAGTASKNSSGKSSTVKKFKSPESEDEEDDSDEEEEDKDSDEEDDDEDSDDISKSGGDKKPGELGSITQMYEKYKKMQELLAKYNTGDLEESATISMSR